MRAGVVHFWKHKSKAQTMDHVVAAANKKMKDYIQLALNTELTTEAYQNKVAERFNDVNTLRLTHAGMGLVTEAAEFIDVLKKYSMYGKEIDIHNLAEELGDCQWYLAVAIDTLANLMGITANELDEKIKQTNIAKLKSRYPEKFNEYHAINRDLDSERRILENG